MGIEKYNHSIDIVKGGLIFLVILGHIIQGSLNDNFIRFFIYSFHMPMFLFISGYLININKLQKYSFTKITRYYIARMLGWWGIAWCIYTYITIEHLTLTNILKNIINPYYHLWYVPTLFSMIITTHIILKMSSNKTFFWYILFVISILCIILDNTTHFPKLIDLGMFFYFTLGVFCRNKKSNYIRINRNIWVIYSIVIVAIYWLVKYFSLLNIQSLLLFPFVVYIIIKWLYPILQTDCLTRCSLLEFWGKNSLLIYLWHVLPIIILKYFFNNTILYYIISLILISLFICLSYCMIKKRLKS
ncbi:acyltransferase family protein [Phocaeicola sp. HCN-40430]|uniref:acyltransferase family protein n=1 Tax=Phocaeicola sp. HCN-40430 TaxID=3134664 RepID=UPI004040BF6A